jgi:hypothetical protein
MFYSTLVKGSTLYLRFPSNTYIKIMKLTIYYSNEYITCSKCLYLGSFLLTYVQS